MSPKTVWGTELTVHVDASAALWAYAPFGVNPEAMQTRATKAEISRSAGERGDWNIVTLRDEGVVPNPDATRFQAAMFRTGNLELLDPVTLT